MDFSMPDSVVPLAGFRRWVRPRIHQRIGEAPHTLITRRHVWPADNEGAMPIKAKCQTFYGQEAACTPTTSPTPRCECGLYAFQELDRAKHYRSMEFGSGSVFGSCIGWGKVFFDEWWWRAEYVLPIAFADPRDTEGHMTTEWISDTLDWLEGVSQRYKMPILPVRELEAYTLQYGSPWFVEPLTDDEEERVK